MKHRKLPLSVIQAFSDVVHRYGDAMAIQSTTCQLTYKELDAKVDLFACYLFKQGVKQGEYIAVASKRSPELIIALLAILKLGGVYVPIDLHYPDERIHYMLSECKIKILIGHMCPRVFTGTFISYHEGMSSTPWPCRFYNTVESHNAAYVNFTSGSSGQPKGVIIPHRGILRLCLNGSYMELNSKQKILHLAAVSFDAATFEIWAALLNGGTCVIYDHEVIDGKNISRIIKKYHVTTLLLTSSLFHLIIDENPRYLVGIKQLLTGGDVASPAHVQRAYNALSEITIYNVYGPTENTTITSYYKISRDFNQPTIPIGKPITKTFIKVIDAELKTSHTGELCVGGEGLAIGYLNNPHLTQEKFIIHQGMRIYRTGDHVRLLEDGNLEFIGRMDSQVKIRGYRIELNEIKFAMNQCATILDTEVMMIEVSGGNKKLVAFVRGSLVNLRAQLEKKLPAYMIPDFFIRMENNFPLTTHGKIDRHQLEKIFHGKFNSKAFVENDIEEKKFFSLLQEILAINAIHRGDDFFMDLGGNSLSVVKAIYAFHRHFSVNIAYSDFYRNSKIEALLDLVKKQHTSSDLSTLQDSQFYYPLSPQQRRYLAMFNINYENSAENVVFFCHFNIPFQEDIFLRTLDYLIQRHAILRSRYQLVEKKLVQIIDDKKEIKIDIFQERSAPMAILKKQEEIRPFCLLQDSLFRIKIKCQHANNWCALFTIHHLLIDGQSVNILRNEMNHVYHAYAINTVPQLPLLKAQYHNFSLAQNQLEDNRLGQLSRENFWSKYFPQGPFHFHLPAKVTELSKRYYAFEYIYQLHPLEINTLKSLCKQYAASLFMYILTRYFLMVSQLMKTPEVVIGVPFSERVSFATENMIGFFPTMLMLKQSVFAENINGLIEKINHHYLEAIDNRAYHVDRYLYDLGFPAHHEGYFPMTGFYLNKIIDNDYFAEAHTHRATSIKGRASLDVTFIEAKHTMWIRTIYRPHVISPSEVEHCIRQLIQ